MQVTGLDDNKLNLHNKAIKLIMEIFGLSNISQGLPSVPFEKTKTIIHTFLIT